MPRLRQECFIQEEIPRRAIFSLDTSDLSCHEHCIPFPACCCRQLAVESDKHCSHCRAGHLLLFVPAGRSRGQQWWAALPGRHEAEEGVAQAVLAPRMARRPDPPRSRVEGWEVRVALDVGLDVCVVHGRAARRFERLCVHLKRGQESACLPYLQYS